MEDKRQLLTIIDAHSIIHRAFHALPPLTAKDGRAVGAVYGFFSIFFKTLRELKPDFAAIAFDSAVPTFRHKIFPDYKAKRKKAPEELNQQIPLIKEILNVFKVKIFEKGGFEADDLIGTIVTRVEKDLVFPNLKIIILSSDADLLQLVDERTKALILKKGVSQTILYDDPAVREKYQGLGPRQLIDYKALRGDPSDNIPGVLGIGEKTATELIKQFQSLENIYLTIEQDKDSLKESLYGKLIQQKEKAFLSQKLARLQRNVDIDFDLKSCRRGEYDRPAVVEVFKNLQFFSLLDKLPDGPTD